MSPQDIARDAIRLVTTAGLGKDVIDLLEKKVALLTEKIATLEQEKLVLKTKNSDLQKEAANLQKELERLQPKQDRLEEGAERILLYLFRSHGESVADEYMGESLGMEEGIAAHYCDVLCAAEMIGPSAYRVFHILPKGRAYAVKHLLKP